MGRKGLSWGGRQRPGVGVQFAPECEPGTPSCGTRSLISLLLPGSDACFLGWRCPKSPASRACYFEACNSASMRIPTAER